MFDSLFILTNNSSSISAFSGGHQLNPSQNATMRDSKPPVRGKTSPYGYDTLTPSITNWLYFSPHCSFFVKMCYEEHKKKYPNENVQVTEISKKCSDKWKVR